MIEAKVTKINFKNFQCDFKNYLIFSQLLLMIIIQPKFPKSQTSKENQITNHNFRNDHVLQSHIYH